MKEISISILTFLLMTLTSNAQFNSDIRDLPTITLLNSKLGKDCPPGRVTDACWQREIKASIGDTIGVQFYYHNTSEYDAVNVALGLNIDTANKNDRYVINGGILVNGKKDVMGYAQVLVSKSTKLKFISKSVTWFPNQSEIGVPLVNGELLFSNYGYGIGIIAPGWQSQGTMIMMFVVQ